MDKFSSYISVSLCGTDEQRAAGTLALREILGAGELEILEGFWQLEPAEVNIKVKTWTNDLESLVPQVAKFMEYYQEYASQEAVFVTFKYKHEREQALVVYPGEWGGLLDEVTGVAELLEYFCDIEDGREDNIPPYS